MGRKRVRTLLLASVTIMLCMALLIGGTYALWSKTVSVTNHLVAGNLDLKLERIALSKNMLDNETGYMKTVSNTDKVDLTTGSDVNVFGIEESELVVPTSCYEATLKLTNNGSVAFTYQIVIKLIEVDEELAEQLMVSVNGVEKGYLSTFNAQDGQVVVASADASADASAVEKGQATTFRVKVEFKDDAAEGVTDIINNAAMDKEVEFDLIVKAVQLTSDPNSAPNGD